MLHHGGLKSWYGMPWMGCLGQGPPHAWGLLSHEQPAIYMVLDYGVVSVIRVKKQFVDLVQMNFNHSSGIHLILSLDLFLKNNANTAWVALQAPAPALSTGTVELLSPLTPFNPSLTLWNLTRPCMVSTPSSLPGLPWDKPIGLNPKSC